MPYPSDQQDRFIVRMPDGMREALSAAAKGNNRSMNAEVVARLQASLSAPADSGRIAELEQAVEVERTRAEGGLYLAGFVAMHFEQILDALPDDCDALLKHANDLPHWRELNAAVRKQALKASLQGPKADGPPTDEEIQARVETGAHRYAALGRQAMVDVIKESRRSEDGATGTTDPAV